MPKKKPAPMRVPTAPTAPTAPTGAAPKLTHNPFAALGGNPQAAEPAAPPTNTKGAERKGRLVLARETKHRGGKAVVVIRGFATLPHWTETEADELARELKQALGTGGTVEAGPTILIQGDRPAEVAAWLRGQGFRVEGVTG
jgi:translation initiation factor 1